MSDDYRITIDGQLAAELSNDPERLSQFLSNLPPVRRTLALPAVYADCLTKISERTGMPASAILTTLCSEAIGEAFNTNRSEFPRYLQDGRHAASRSSAA